MLVFFARKLIKKKRFAFLLINSAVARSWSWSKATQMGLWFHGSAFESRYTRCVFEANCNLRGLYFCG